MFKLTLSAAFIASTMLVPAVQADTVQPNAKPVINICTGGEDKPYNLDGKYIASFLSNSRNMTVQVQTSDGTWDNIQRSMLPATDPDSCQVFIGQPDGPVLLKRQNPGQAAKLKKIGNGPVEYLHVLCNKESGITDLSQLAGDNSRSVALGPEGSGAWLIWQNFVAEDDSYGEVQVTDESGAIAMSSVAAGDTTCALVPAAVVNQTVAAADADFGDQLVLAGANDKDFNDATAIDGKPLYTWAAIPSGSYPENLQAGWFTSVDTIAWQAGVYVNKDAFKGNTKALEDLITAVAKTKAGVKNTYGTLGE